MKPISPAKKQTVISLLLDNKPTRKIEKEVGVGKSTVDRIRKEVEPTKENVKIGRPSKLSSLDQRRIISQIKSGRLDNAVQATDFINSVNTTPVCPQTVRNVLGKAKMRSVVKRKRPLLKKVHGMARLSFARKYQDWTVDDWKMVLWSDEVKINRVQSDGRVWTWKEEGEPLTDRTTTPTVKYGGGSVMVWGCMGWNGVGILTEVEGKMDAKQYVDILERGLLESVEKLEMNSEAFYFQQDNDPKHTSKKAFKWFESKGINVLDWPSQSPDLNPIEHLWAHIKRQLHKYPSPPSGLHELWDRLAEEWNKIPPETCQGLIESMPRRCQAVLKANGGHTKY